MVKFSWCRLHFPNKNVREYRTVSHKWTIQRNWQHDEKQNKNTTQNSISKLEWAQS